MRDQGQHYLCAILNFLSISLKISEMKENHRKNSVSRMKVAFHANEIRSVLKMAHNFSIFFGRKIANNKSEAFKALRS
jgi:hypothetical protein